jgi:uncharacterized protein (TIGR01777 family)
MRAIVFGGTGLIGSALLGSPGMGEYETVVVSRNPKKNKSPGTIQHVSYDQKILAGLFKGDYGIINLAGAGIGARLWTKNRQKVILDSRIRVNGFINDLVTSAIDKPDFIIQASAMGYYGNRGDETLTEESGQGHGYLADITGKWEAALHQDTALSARVIFLRTGLVLSAEGGFLQPSVGLFRLFAGGHFGNGQQWMPWIHMADEVGAILHLMAHKTASGAFNLVSPNPVRGLEFYRILGHALRRPSWLHAPSFILRMIPNGFGEELLLTSQHVKPMKLLGSGYTFKYPELRPALTDLFSNE